MSTIDKSRALPDSYVAEDAKATGALIINADDWGIDLETTNCIRACLENGRVSRASGMVFMEDSTRAAEIACANGFDIGLHLNLTTPFTASLRPSKIIEHLERVATYLRRSWLSQCLFNPALMSSFKYLVAAQFDEYERLYGKRPTRVDGHHHKHLCANIVLTNLLPAGIRVRRNFSFQAGDKNIFNRTYRRLLDRLLARRYQLTDYFLDIRPVEQTDRLKMIVSLSRQFVVEVETHPRVRDEYLFLNGELFAELTNTAPLVRSYLRSPI